MDYSQGMAPYYDNFNEEKNYSALLFRPGLILQNAELNELQSMLSARIKRIGDTILTNGDIIEGCQLIVQNVSEQSIAKKCTITAGRIYIGGDVFNTQQAELTLTGVGIEKIGVKIVREVITELEDPDLLDPSAGLGNYMQSGSHRLKTRVEFVIDTGEDDSVSTVFTLEDGVPINSVVSDGTTTVVDRINTTLARRTFDESGNYRANGLSLVAKGITDNNNIYITMESGKAYVKGFEITKQTAITIPIRRSTDLRTVVNEPKIYTTGTDKYKINNKPVSEVTRLTGVIQVTAQITRQGATNGRDPLPIQFTPAVEIVKIEQTGTSTVYQKNVDYVLEGDEVRWLEGDNREPDLGSTYTCTFTYNKTMVQGVDYDLHLENGEYYIRILNGDKPVQGTTMLIEYNFMLYRRDVLTMDERGNVLVVEGQPDILSTVESPQVNNPDVLILGSVLSKPLDDNPGIINNNNTRLTMDDLHRLLTRVEELEFNQAYTDLDNEAMQGENASELKGIFTDGFIGLTKADVDHAEFNASIDLEEQELTLSSVDTLHELEIATNIAILPGPSFTQYDTLVTAKATERVLVSQTTATGVMKINSYAVFPASPVVSVSPSVDNWVEESKVTVQGATVTTTVTLRRWWSHKGESWANSEKAQWEALGFKNGGAGLGFGIQTTTNTHSVVSSVLDTAITYMRQNTITVTVSKFPAFTNNIVCTFDGIKVNVTPSSSAYQGTQTGTLRTDANGYCKGTFTIPANVLCGTVNVQVYPMDAPNLVGSTPYTANGRKRVIETTVWKEIVKVNAVDPLAQSFQLSNDQFITGIDLYFKDRGTQPVSVQIRNVENGYPGNICYAEKVLNASELKVSNDSSVNTKVMFDDPVFCKKDTQYCFVILTEDNTTSMYYSNLGDTDILTKTAILKNPYLEGVMFSSSNAMTWTAHQAMNLKFKLYADVYESGTGYLYFNEIKNVSYDRIMIAADTSIPTYTELTWEYSTDSGSTWMPITPFADIELSAIATKLLFRATFKTNGLVSPAISMESIYLVGFSNNTQCNYVSKNVNMANKFYTVKQIVDVYAPTGTGVVLFYATDQIGSDWKSAPQDESNPPVTRDEAGWIRYTYKADVSAGASNYRVKVALTTNNRTVRPKVKNLMSILK